MRFIACLIALTVGVLVFASEAAAQAADPAGKWAVRSQGRAMVIVTLKREANGWRGEIERPATLTTDGASLSLNGVKGPRSVRAINSARESTEGLVLNVASGGMPTTSSNMTFSVRSDGTARLKPEGMPGDGFVLARARPDETLFTDWDTSAEYPIDQHWQTSAEMARIFEADQAARQSININWTKVAPEDAERRKATRALLDAGKLESAEDFYRAAFVFQHGDKPEDFLLAHTLAIVSAARGKPTAAWIAAATLDRYLQAVGQKQIYGTQYMNPQNAEATQEPYDRALVSDGLRAALGVPPIAEQEETRRRFSPAQ